MSGNPRCAAQESVSEAILHSRHVYFSRALVRGRPRVGRSSMRNLGRDDLPPLSEMDSWASGWRRKENRSAVAGIYRGPRAQRTVPQTVPNNSSWVENADK